MGKIQILAHKKYIGVRSFQNAAPKALSQNFYIISMKYYLKWLKQPEGIHLWEEQLKQLYKMRSLHAGKCIMIERLRFWSISQ